MALLSASAMRVCQPGPVALHRNNVSGGSRREMDLRALPVFGRPRGFPSARSELRLRFITLHLPSSAAPIVMVGYLSYMRIYDKSTAIAARASREMRFIRSAKTGKVDPGSLKHKHSVLG